MFDYLDDVVALQATIFNSITTFGVSSMTPSGQCRLAPLIPTIQDSNQLYDFAVRLMFLLHANLPDDLLTGHRERFRTLFRQLNSFYKQAGQVFKMNNYISSFCIIDSNFFISASVFCKSYQGNILMFTHFTIDLFIFVSLSGSSASIESTKLSCTKRFGQL